jgi:hypothetical protein
MPEPIHQEPTDAPQAPSPEGPTAREDGPPSSPPQEEADEQVEVDNRQTRRDAEFRTRAVAAEARADRLAAREVERLLAAFVTSPADALALGESTAGRFVNEQGDVDTDALEEFARTVTASRPWLRKVQGHHGDMGPKRTAVARPSPTWSDAFKPQPR